MSKKYKNNAKIGFVGFTYPAPKGLSRFDATLWQMKEAYDMGCELFSAFTFGMSEDEAKQIDEKIQEYGFEQEGFMPFAVFELAGFQGADPVKAKETVEQIVEQNAAKGVKIIRGAYNSRLDYKYSRWNLEPGWTGEEQKANVIESLKLAAPILEKNGCYLAIENHLDFTGKEFDEIYTAVGSKHIGCAYDTANGLFLNTDPNYDIAYMPKWAITTHIKDSKIVDTPHNGNDTGPNGPLIPVGCALGDGVVNVKKALDEILDKSPMKDGIHLILETGWFGATVNENNEMDEYNRQILRQSMAWLKGYLTL